MPVNFTAPAEAVSEHRVSVSWAVENRGDGGASPSWHDRLYGSTNETWEAGDVALDTFTPSQALAPGSNYAATASFTVPVVMAGDV